MISLTAAKLREPWGEQNIASDGAETGNHRLGMVERVKEIVNECREEGTNTASVLLQDPVNANTKVLNTA